jgi:hypothetical protein
MILWTQAVCDQLSVQFLCRYPGGPLFDPMGLASDISKPQPLKLKELKNGILLLIACKY